MEHTSKMKKKILVIGGSGNLGSSLKSNNFFKKQFFPSSKVLNILKKKDIIKFINKHEIEMVINCAALARMKECEIKKNKAFNVNVLGSQNLIEVLKKIKYRSIKLIHISSDAVYPCLNGDYSEKSRTRPYNYYGETKALAEKLVRKYVNHTIIRTRFFNKKLIKFNTVATDSYSSSLEVKKLVNYIKFLVNKDFIGTINVGGKKISDYDLYKKYKKNLKKCLYYDIQKKLNFKISKDASMNCSLLNKLMIKSNV